MWWQKQVLKCFVFIFCLYPFRTPVPTHLPTAFPTVSYDMPELPEPVVPSPSSPELPSVCQEGLCRNGGTCHPISLPSGATSFQCDCPLHFTGRFCEKGSCGSFFLYYLWNACLTFLWNKKRGRGNDHHVSLLSISVVGGNSKIYLLRYLE